MTIKVFSRVSDGMFQITDNKESGRYDVIFGSVDHAISRKFEYRDLQSLARAITESIGHGDDA